MRVLIAGFGPFPGAPRNVSAELAAALARRRRPALVGLSRTAHVIATSYAAVDRELPHLFAQRPDIVLLLGLAARRAHVCIEMRARNAVSVLHPDVEGRRPARPTVDPGAPAALTGRAPFVHLLAASRTSGLPARLSRDAGRYLCNYVYWRALRLASKGGSLVQFVHVPAVRRDRLPSRRRGLRPAHRAPTARQLIVATERVLLALIAARRR